MIKTPDHTVGNKSNIKTQRWVLIISIFLFALKLLAYLLTSSVAIFTDMLESIVNVVAGLIGLISLIIAAKPRDHDHPYGHGKAELISSTFEGLLIAIAGIMIIIEASKNYFSPNEIKQLDWGILLIVITAVINFITGYFCIRTGKRNKSLALIASGKHLQTDTYSTIGILIGLGVLYFTNYYWIDSVMAIVFGVIIIITSAHILKKSIAGIMDEADIDLLKEVTPVLEQYRRSNWIDIHNLRIIKYGPVLHFDCHLTLPWYTKIKDAHEELMHLENLMKKHYGNQVELFIHTDACQPFSCELCTLSACDHRLHEHKKTLKWDTKYLTQLNKHTID
jgi:cation diffusion facilitator family transporter